MNLITKVHYFLYYTNYIQKNIEQLTTFQRIIIGKTNKICNFAKKLSHMYKNYKVIANTAAGRRRYMQYLVPYILSSDIIDQYDIWVNTNNGADTEFFRLLANMYPKINLVWQPDGYVDGISSINSFYKTCTDNNTIYFKLDDDIVWMQPDTIELMVKFRVEHPNYFLVSPLVINNSLCTYLMQIRNKISISHYCRSNPFSAVMWRDGHFAYCLHKWFQKCIENDTYKSLHLGAQPVAMCRFSINAILWFGKDFRVFQGIVTGDDEEFLSCIYPSIIGKSNCINGDAILAHFAFYPQREILDQKNILDKYRMINLESWNKNKSSITDTYKNVQEILNYININANKLEPLSAYKNVPAKSKANIHNYIKKITPKSLEHIKHTLEEERIYKKIKIIDVS
jgi:hypothetical protein